jgi:hypothetical protein
MCAFQKDKQWMKISSRKIKKKKKRKFILQLVDDNDVLVRTLKGTFTVSCI